MSREVWHVMGETVGRKSQKFFLCLLFSTFLKKILFAFLHLGHLASSFPPTPSCDPGSHHHYLAVWGSLLYLCLASPLGWPPPGASSGWQTTRHPKIPPGPVKCISVLYRPIRRKAPGWGRQAIQSSWVGQVQLVSGWRPAVRLWAVSDSWQPVVRADLVYTLVLHEDPLYLDWELLLRKGRILSFSCLHCDCISWSWNVRNQEVNACWWRKKGRSSSQSTKGRRAQTLLETNRVKRKLKMAPVMKKRTKNFVVYAHKLPPNRTDFLSSLFLST